MDAGEPYGVLTWLLAMVCSFVAAGTLVSKTTLGPADASFDQVQFFYVDDVAGSTTGFCFA